MVARPSLSRLVRAVALLILLSTLSILALAGPAAAATDAERQMFRLINRARADRGEERLEMKAWLVRNARTHTQKMADRGEWFHNDRLARQLADRRWNTLGENVGHAPTVGSMHRWFMQSPVHRRNILHGRFDRIGIGIVRRGSTLWFTQVFAG